MLHKDCVFDCHVSVQGELSSGVFQTIKGRPAFFFENRYGGGNLAHNFIRNTKMFLKLLLT